MPTANNLPLLHVPMVRLGLAGGITMPMTVAVGMFVLMAIIDHPVLLGVTSFALLAGHFALAFLFVRKMPDRPIAVLGILGWIMTGPALWMVMDRLLTG